MAAAKYPVLPKAQEEVNFALRAKEEKPSPGFLLDFVYEQILPLFEKKLRKSFCIGKGLA